MTHLDGCPDTESLTRLNAGELDADEERLIREHMAGCPKCRQTSETLIEKSAPESVKQSEVATLPPTDPLAAKSDPADNARSDDLATGNWTGEHGDTGSTFLWGTMAKIAGYELLEELGRGGMGVVYKARQVALKREVAIKMVLAGTMAGPQDLARFRTEAEAVARLRHPGIVQIFEIGEVAGRPFFSLEFVPGGSLSSQLDGTPLPERQAATLVEKIARAMHAAHEQSVIHRDLKPANVLMTAAGEPKITDFGLAKQLDDDSGQTQSGAIMGTPSYMAPEQALGNIADIGPRTDVYALGAILYELLTGRPPFKAATPLETVRMVVTEEPVPPSRLRSKLSPDLETICLKCLDHAVSKRYDSAEELAEDLRRWLAGEPILARPVGRVEKTIKWMRRNKALAASLAAVFLVFAVGAVVSSVLAFVANEARVAEKERADELEIARENERKKAEDLRVAEKALKQRATELAAALADAKHQTKIAREQTKFADEQKNLAQKQSRLAEEQTVLARAQTKIAEEKTKVAVFERDKAEFVAYAFRIDAARQAAEKGQRDKALASLRLCPPDLCNWEHDHVLRQTGTRSPAQLLSGHKERISCVAIAPDGRHVVSASWDGFVKLWDADTGKEIRTLHKFGREAYGVAFSSDGTKVVAVGHHSYNLNNRKDPDFGREGLAMVWDAITFKTLLTIKPKSRKSSEFYRCVAFDPAGKTIVMGDAGGEITTWDASSGKRFLAIDTRSVASIDSVAFTPDGKRIVSAGQDGKVRIWDSANGNPISDLNVEPRNPNGFRVAISPDGSQIVTGGRDLKIWDLQSGLLVATLSGHSRNVLSVAFSPDGERIVSGAMDNTVRVWDAHTGMEAYTFQVPNFVESVAFSPDGKKIVCGGFDKIVRVWDATTGMETRTLRGHDGSVTSLAMTRDGKYLVTAGQDNKVLVWDGVRGEVVLSLPVGADAHVAMRPDGKVIAATHGSPGQQKLGLWDRATGKLLHEVPLSAERGYNLAFKPDGKQVAVCGEKAGIIFYDAQTGQAAETIKAPEVSRPNIVFSNDGKQIARAGHRLGSRAGTQLSVWDAATGKLLFVKDTVATQPTSVALSPDGKFSAVGITGFTAAAGRNGRIVRKWYGAIQLFEGNRLVATLKGHDREGQPTEVNVAFSPDGRYVVSGGQDHSIRVWDVASRKEVDMLVGHYGAVNCVAVTQDGRIISASEDRSIKIWEMPDKAVVVSK